MRLLIFKTNIFKSVYSSFLMVELAKKLKKMAKYAE